jgi:undecaprenyl phosphate N,N'-diacetylbacillosamine 1-phosphate transferase
MYLKVKRLLDLIFSLIIITLIWPFFLLIAVLIKIDSRGPVIYKQYRLGLNGKVFKIYKFRSMCVDAEKNGVYETKRDSRVTRIGKFIRKTSIDEFPQFINILKGDMSIIGPRPSLTYHPWKLDEYTEKQKKRFDVRPGITGWAQVNGRKNVSWNERIKYDLDYVCNLSFSFDAKILFKTIIKVITMQDNINIEETVQNNNDA